VSHDAILISATIGAALVLFTLYSLYQKIRSAVSNIGRRWEETLKLADVLKANYAEIKAKQHADTAELRDAVAALSVIATSIDAQLKDFIPKYLAQGEPLAAVPNILKSQVGGLVVLKETIDAFAKTIIGNTAGSYTPPDERREAAEDEVLRIMDKAHCTREEALERIEQRQIWSRVGNLIGSENGNDD